METLEDLEKEFERLQQPRRKKIYTPKIYPTKTKEQIQKEFEEDYKIVLEKDYNKKVRAGKVRAKDELTFEYNLGVEQRNPRLYNFLFHSIQMEKLMKRYPNSLYIHQMKIYKNNKRIRGFFQLTEGNPYYDEIKGFTIGSFKYKFTKESYKTKTKSIGWDTLIDSPQYWIPELLINEPDGEDYNIVITTKAYKKFKYNERDMNQIFKDSDTGACFYDGIINYLELKPDNKKAKAIINKLVKNEEKYKKGYTLDEINIFCQEFKISVIIRDLIAGSDIKINENKFNIFRIEFLNTKYNHIDLLSNQYKNIEEVEEEKYNEIKENENFYIESFGKLTTLTNTYTRKKSDFENVFTNWVNKNNIKNYEIFTNSETYELLNKYDYNIHSFGYYSKFTGNENDYKEIDMRKAYYNYNDKNYNKFYMGLCSGSFINCSCKGYNVDTFKKQIENKIIGFYQIKITKHLKNSFNLEKLGFGINTVHVLFSPTILLLLDYLEFDFLNASISPSIHLKNDKGFIKEEKDKDGEQIHKTDGGTKYFTKACGCLFKESNDINIIVKPLKNDDKFYKTFYNKKYSVYRDDKGLYNISIDNPNKKSKIHLIYGIHAYTTTIILNDLLKMDLKNVLGVKLDSIVVKKDYEYKYDENIYKIKVAKSIKGFYSLDYEFGEGEEEESVPYKQSLFEDDNILFKKIFTPTNEHLYKKLVYFGGIGGSGKSYTILNNLDNRNILFTCRSWDLIQFQQNNKPDIIGLSIPKITGKMKGQKVERIINNNIRYIVIDEMTMSDKEEINDILKLYPGCWVFMLGDISEDGFPYQCTINEHQIYKPNEKTQYIKFTKTYRFDEELNNKLNLLRANQYENKDKPNRIKLHYKYFKELFSDRFFDVKDINFNSDDVGISTHDDTKKENKLTKYFIENKKAEEQYFIKSTNLNKNQLRGQKLEEKPTHSNFENKLFKTIHSFQGKELTLKNKIIIFVGALFDYSIFYTAVSRARRTDQIYIFDKY